MGAMTDKIRGCNDRLSYFEFAHFGGIAQSDFLVMEDGIPFSLFVSASRELHHCRTLLHGKKRNDKGLAQNAVEVWLLSLIWQVGYVTDGYCTTEIRYQWW